MNFQYLIGDWVKALVKSGSWKQAYYNKIKPDRFLRFSLPMTNTTEELSERELEILRLVATGASNKEIASQLYISANTVKVHLRNIFTKINASSRTEAAMYAVSQGLVPSGVTPAIMTDFGGVDEDKNRSESIDWSIKRLIALWLSLPRWASISLGLLFSLLALSLALGFRSWLSGRSQVLNSAGNVVNEIPERWQQLTPMPVARSASGITSYEGKIFVIAGQEKSTISNSITSFDPVTNAWVARASKPTAVRDVGAVAVGGRIYVPGGLLSSGHVTDVLEIYDPRQDVWSEGQRLPIALSGYAMTVFEGRLYLFGGWDGEKFLDIIFTYDPVNDRWAQENSLLKPRAFAGATVSGGKIYLVGGYDGEKTLTTTDIYLPGSDIGSSASWEEGPELPDALSQVAITSIADIIFVIGSDNGDGKQANGWQLLPQTDSWVAFDIPVDLPWVNLGLTSLSTKLYLVGGILDGEFTNQSMSYQAIYTLTLPVISR